MAPQNLRLVPVAGNVSAAVSPDDDDVIDVILDGVDPEVADEDIGATIKTPDGSVVISFGPPGRSRVDEDDWNANLAEDLDDLTLGEISNELIEGVEADIQSRQGWVENRSDFVRLLGATLEPLGAGESSSPVEGMSRVRHPMLLEAVVRFQSNARAELLPTDGPVKIRNDDPQASLDDVPLSEALAKDMNRYLTTTASEYYPDTDRMLFKLGLGGSEFKKVYHCPLRKRPVSESVDAENLIVSNNATDLANALRVTHRIPDMKASRMKRLQLAGVYRDIDLAEPSAPMTSLVDQNVDQMLGVDSRPSRPKDTPFEVWEIYTELNLPGYEHKIKGKPTGLPLPYRVSIEKTSREVLEIRRNWKQKDENYSARKTFVHYCYVPGFGFYGLGLGNFIANIATAVTAAWREMLDNGMFANFPGFLIAKEAARQSTNVMRVPPGGAHQIDVGERSIRDVVMELPYRDPSPVFMEFVNHVSDAGMRLGNIAEIQVGEGKQNAPVGTTLALIEQTTQVLSAVHKRLYTAQSEELQMLVDLFREDPESLWRGNRRPAHAWTESTLLQALQDTDLVPVADPNTASHMQRVMKATAIEQLSTAHPDLYDERAVQTLLLSLINIGQPAQLFKSEDEAQQPDGPTMQAMAELQLKKRELDIKERESEIKTGVAQIDAQNKQLDAQAKMADTQAKVQIAGLTVQREEAKTGIVQQELGLKAAALEHDRNEADRAHQLGVIGMQLEQDKTSQAAQLSREAEQHEDRRAVLDADLARYVNDADNETAIKISEMEITADERMQKASNASAERREHAKAKAMKVKKSNLKNGNGINPGRR